MIINEKNYKDAAEVKNEIIKLMNDCNNDAKKGEELINFLQECSVNPDLKNNYENFQYNDSNTEYRYCGQTNSNYLAYCINNEGRLQVIYTDGKADNWDNGKKINIKDYDKEKSININLVNGYIAQSSINVELKEHSATLAAEKDIYLFMKDAKWLDDDDSLEPAKLNTKSKIEKDTLEVHHINNRPDDNRVDNLVWLPRSIHCQAHKYTRIYTFELTQKQYEAVIKCLAE